MAGTRFECKEHSLFDGSGTAAGGAGGGAGGGPGVRGRRAVSVAPPRHSRVQTRSVRPGERRTALMLAYHRQTDNRNFIGRTNGP